MEMEIVQMEFVFVDFHGMGLLVVPVRIFFLLFFYYENDADI